VALPTLAEMQAIMVEMYQMGNRDVIDYLPDLKHTNVQR